MYSVVFLYSTDNLWLPLLVSGLHKPLRELCLLFFNAQSIRHEMIHLASKPWPSQADRATSKACQHGNIIKAKRWLRKTKTKDRQWQALSDHNTSLQISHWLLLACVKRPPTTKKFVTTLSRSLWAFLISSDFYPALIHLCRSSRPGSARLTASSRCHLSPPLTPSVSSFFQYACNQRSSHLRIWYQLLPSITI